MKKISKPGMAPKGFYQKATFFHLLLMLLLLVFTADRASGQTKLWGLTFGGGAGYGVIFEYDLAGAGTYTVKHNFDGTNGRFPHGSLIESGGKFYGMTGDGGSSNKGVVFEYDPAGAGTYTVIQEFDGTNGGNPFGSLIESGGKFYGMAGIGGSSNRGVIFEYDPAGAGIYTVMHEFDGTNGKFPLGSLLESGGKFYGMTQYGGSSD